MDPCVEQLANESIAQALKAIQRALDLSKAAGYGSLVVGPLADAQQEVTYALDTAVGRN
jgi:hypothetical protein